MYPSCLSIVLNKNILPIYIYVYIFLIERAEPMKYDDGTNCSFSAMLLGDLQPNSWLVQPHGLNRTTCRAQTRFRLDRV